ncbi:IS66 family transposase [Enterocloster bolteae]|uniref:IS66 family transposase n=1 Tax=Enterocloster bolteae TaxID=208479 RepID=UPI000FFC252E|nr:IS66 family transposase [Enterocloster bolteae]UOX69930.1 IS66 family transposase [Enterocloster bolteae]
MEALMQLQKETIESLRQLVDSQRLTIEQMAKSHEEQTTQMNQTIVNLNETVEYLPKKLFASSSEKTKKDGFSGQMALFNEAKATADPSVLEPALEEIVGDYKRKAKKPKATREEILAGLPVVGVPCTVPEEDRNCPYCNAPMAAIGKKVVREELQIIPAKVERIQYVQEVLGCPECKRDGASVIVGAETPSPLLKHSLASPSTVAYVMYQKYVDSIPLYRQEADWRQLGVKLPRATLANWVIKCGIDYMEPVYERLHQHLLERDMIHADETSCQVLKEEGKTAQSKSYMWLYGSGNDELPPIRLYDYQPSRGGYHAEEFLKGFSGYLTCDGFGGYNKLKDVIRCGCLAHMRRYWHEALPGKSKKSSDRTLAEIGFDYCNQLFKLEKEYADMDADTRKARRLETEPAIWEAYWSWLETVNPAGGSRLAKAVTYAKNQKPYMENYLLDGRCFISNNIAENIARPYAVGRKNFLFHDTVKGARASSIIYSLVETAKLNNLNIYAYLETVLLYMPDYKNEPEGIEELMPWSDMIQQRCRIKLKS